MRPPLPPTSLLSSTLAFLSRLASMSLTMSTEWEKKSLYFSIAKLKQLFKRKTNHTLNWNCAWHLQRKKRKKERKKKKKRIDIKTSLWFKPIWVSFSPLEALEALYLNSRPRNCRKSQILRLSKVSSRLKHEFQARYETMLNYPPPAPAPSRFEKFCL